jgi:hypothetical protein
MAGCVLKTHIQRTLLEKEGDMQTTETEEEERRRRTQHPRCTNSYCDDKSYSINSIVVNVLCIAVLVVGIGMCVMRIRQLLVRDTFLGIVMPVPKLPTTQRQHRAPTTARRTVAPLAPLAPPPPPPSPPTPMNLNLPPPVSTSREAELPGVGPMPTTKAASEYSLLSLQRFIQQQQTQPQDTRTVYD